MPLLLAVPDKFRGTVSAAQAAAAIAAAARHSGWQTVAIGLSDGGEGFLDVFPGETRWAKVHDPLGRMIGAPWKLRVGLDGSATGIVEMARASGLALVGGAAGNDPWLASTYGTGELVLEAARSGVRRVLVGCGGSATTDGGIGAVLAIGSPDRLGGVEVVVAYDVDMPFLAAARVFGPQKGADRETCRQLTMRLAAIAEFYRDEWGLDVSALAGAGAAGGLAGGMACLGAMLRPGFEVVAEEIGLRRLVEQADLVVTGEGHLDGTSLAGKVVGGVLRTALDAGVEVACITGGYDPAVLPRLPDRCEVLSLVEEVGEERAFADAEQSIRQVARCLLARRSGCRP